MNNIVKTEYGYVKGLNKDGYTAYLGIPYAKPPINNLSFKHPEKPNKWSGTLNAIKGSKNPIQPKTKWSNGNNSQDCLYLNIFVPKTKLNNLPVMVWIYGGAFNNGGAGCQNENTDELSYDLGNFAKKTNTIVVTLNYRLNIYGFLNLNFLDKNFDLNNGLYDQLMALQFIKDNITNFNGNKDNITLFGQSAGGLSTLIHICSKKSKNLFNKAIVQSACAKSLWTLEESKKITKQYLKLLNIKSPKELFNIPESKLLKANLKLTNILKYKGELRCAFSPVIDNIFIDDYPENIINNNNIPILIGYTKDEANNLTGNIPSIILSLYSKIHKLKIPDKKDKYLNRFNEYIKLSIFKDPTISISKNYKSNLWLYEYQFNPLELRKRNLNSCHASELPVLFEINLLFCNPKDKEIIPMTKKMQKIWSDFAWNSTIPWNQYKENNNTYIIK